MNDWDFSPPPPSSLNDHGVVPEGSHLSGRRIALLITGGIAAMKSPFIARALRRQGADVVAFISEEGLRYVTLDALEWSTTRPVITRLTAAAEHLSDAAPFDAYLVAPATYNTINKMAQGIADGVVTATLGSALGRMEQRHTKILVAPTMHGSLHNAILTESLKKLAAMGVRIIPPRDDYGKHNIPNEPVLVAEVCRAVSRSPLTGLPLLITGGPTPVPVDGVRRITNRFTGQLGVEIGNELYLRGAEALLVLGGGMVKVPDYLPVAPAGTYDDYYRLVMAELARWPYQAAIFSAAVADYRPEQLLPGKTPSGGALQQIRLVPTVKVIAEVRQQFPNLTMITFKYQEGISHRELMTIARERLAQGYQAVVANRGEEVGPAGEQVAYLVTGKGESRQLMGKQQIAIGIADYLETIL